jgi:ABC-type branched-subunit amino acid transport system substrate-binding protein
MRKSTPLDRTSSRTAAEVAAELGVLLWNHGGASDEVQSGFPGSCVSVPSPASSYMIAPLEMLEAHELSLRRIAIVHSRSGFGAEVARGAVEWARSRGLEIVRRAYAAGDFAAVEAAAREVSHHAPEAILGAGRFEDDLTLAEALWRTRPETRAVVLVAAGVAEFGRALGGRANGFFAPVQWHPEARTQPDLGPTSEAFVQLFRSRTGLTPGYPAAQAYAAALVALRCAERSGGCEARRLWEEARCTRLTTFYGRFAIDPRTGRQTGHGVLVVQWRCGRQRLVWPELGESDGGRQIQAPWDRR